MSTVSDKFDERGPSGVTERPRSHRLYLELAASEVAMFRFLLEAYDNLAYFTVADRRRAVLKVVYAPDARRDLDYALDAMSREVDFRILPDFPAPEQGRL